MTRAEFIDKYRFTMAGGFLYGSVIEATEGPLVRAAHAHRIPAQVERLLNRIFDDLIGPEPPPEPSKNGKAAESRKV